MWLQRIIDWLFLGADSIPRGYDCEWNENSAHVVFWMYLLHTHCHCGFPLMARGTVNLQKPKLKPRLDLGATRDPSSFANPTVLPVISLADPVSLHLQPPTPRHPWGTGSSRSQQLWPAGLLRSFMASPHRDTDASVSPVYHGLYLMKWNPGTICLTFYTLWRYVLDMDGRNNF